MTLEDFLTEWRNAADTVLVHTSGSTGKPKPLRVEKRRMLNSARITCDFLGLHPGDAFLLCMPLDYIAGKMVVVRCIERRLRLFSIKPSGHPMAWRGDTECVDFSESNPSIGHCASLPSEISAVAMVPLQVYNSLQVAEERERLKAVGHLIIGGGAIDDRMAKELRDFPNCVWSTYGMTETLSHIALRRLSGKEAGEWYTPFDSVMVSQTADGCLTIDAPMVHDGLLKTNDIVEMRTVTVNGKVVRQFRVRGRKDNVIDSGGIKIQIEEVEAALKPFLKKPFAITKVADEKFGETVTLVTEATDMAEMAEVCANALPKYWQPHRYIHVERLPMTETGKPARRQIEQMAAKAAVDVSR